MRLVSRFVCAKSVGAKSVWAKSVWAAGALAASALFASSANAALLTHYQFGSPGDETLVETGAAYGPTFSDPGVTGSPVTEPGTIGIEISSATGGTPPVIPPGAPYLRINPEGGAADPAAAFSAGKYFQFSITAGGSKDVDLSSLTFEVARGGTTTARGFTIRSSADNYANPVPASGSPALIPNGVGYNIDSLRPAYTAVTVDLSGAAYQNIQDLPSSTLTFRVYSHSPGAGSSVDFDNIAINGTVTEVPEPGVAGLLIGLTVPALLRRRSGARRTD